MAELPNALPKQVVAGSNPAARSNHPTIAHTSIGSSLPCTFPCSRVFRSIDTVVKVFQFLTLSAILLMSVSCHYYEEYRVMKTKADLQEEHAELLKAYRLCLAKYEDEPPKAKELCAPYTQSLREIEVRHQGNR